MKWTILASSAILAAALWWPSRAAEPAPAAPAPAISAAATPASAAAPATAATAGTAAPATISFDAYRDYRLHEFAGRQARLAKRLAASDLDAPAKARLEHQKAYYDWLAAMPADARDRRFRARFDEIDANHDGQLDPAERAAWRTKERDYYRAQAAARSAAAQ